MRRNRDRVSGGVVHSFTGTQEEALELVSMGRLLGSVSMQAPGLDTNLSTIFPSGGDGVGFTVNVVIGLR